jgi:type IV pilus assembly protein PilX
MGAERLQRFPITTRGAGLDSGRGAGARRHAGAVLILGLVVLLVITIIGVTGMHTTVMQERMAGNLRQKNIALQSAEAALQASLTYVSDLPVQNTNSIASDIVAPECNVEASAETIQEGGDDPCAFDEILDNWNGPLENVTAGVSYADVLAELGESGALPHVIAQPRVYIEAKKVDTSGDNPMDTDEGAGTWYFTVTAVGFGESEQFRAIVQSTVAKLVP